MKNKFHSQRGQAIVMIAIAIVGLVGMTALAIDGGNAFSDRRHAQNAADTAVISAALSKIRVGGTAWQGAGLTMAIANGYDDADTNQTVTIHTCESPPSSEFICPSPYDSTDSDQYIHLVIESKTDTFFATVVGIPQITNTVEAIARAKPSFEMYSGNAMVSLGQTNNPQPVCEINGGAGGSVIGGGIFCNSSSNCAFDVDGGSGTMSIPEGITVVGTACDIDDIGLSSSSVSDGAEQLPTPDYSWLDPVCDGAVNYDSSVHLSGDTITPTAGSPLYFSGSFPPSSAENLNAGVYCLDDTFRVNNGSLTGSDVTFVMLSKGLTWNGGTINLSAPSSGETADLLIYQPIANTSALSIGGNVTLDIRGTILTPGAQIGLAGGAHTEINGQLIGLSIDFTGSTGTTISYLDEENINDPPQIELIQ